MRTAAAVLLAFSFAYGCGKELRNPPDVPPPREQPARTDTQQDTSTRALPYTHPIYRFPVKRNPRPDDIVPNPQVHPVRISGEPPKYPDIARKARIAGVVVVELLIERDGRVSAARILKPLPFGLDQAAIEAVRTWRYKPAMQDGRRVRTLWKEAVPLRPLE